MEDYDDAKRIKLEIEELKLPPPPPPPSQAEEEATKQALMIETVKKGIIGAPRLVCVYLSLYSCISLFHNLTKLERRPQIATPGPRLRQTTLTAACSRCTCRRPRPQPRRRHP